VICAGCRTFPYLFGKFAPQRCARGTFLSGNEEILERAEGVVIAGRYRLVRKLGSGGMGSVWHAHDISLDSRCALKLIDEDKAQSDEVRVRFEREAKAAAQLRGAHVVDVFEHGESDGTLYIAMEYLDGEDLGARLDRVGRLDGENTYRIVAHVCRALVRAHANGIVHRDLKPENIFLVQGDEEEIAKVLDFGIAKHDAYSLHDKATRTGSFLGTPFYVSPEQARGKSTDYRSDLWSLGIIVFQCLTGRPPFESEALGELMGLILYEDLPRITARNPELPSTMDAWWERAAARDREQRFQSAKELSDALGHALSLKRVVSVPTIAPRRASLPDGTGQHATASGSFPPAPGLPRMSTPPSVLPSFTDPEWAEDRLETDAPVSRTRHSAAPVALRFERVFRLARRARRLLTKKGLSNAVATVRAQPKRNLVALAIGAGALLGIVLTLALSGSERPTASAPPATIVRAAAPPPVVEPKPVVTPVPLPTAAPATSSSALAEPGASAAAASSATISSKSESGEPKRRAPAPRRRPPPTRGPDYGI
jgi:serine/threonine protein kinase